MDTAWRVSSTAPTPLARYRGSANASFGAVLQFRRSEMFGRRLRLIKVWRRTLYVTNLLDRSGQRRRPPPESAASRQILPMTTLLTDRLKSAFGWEIYFLN